MLNERRLLPVSSTNHFDIVIVGGGLVGAGLAISLRHLSLRIALVDAKAVGNADNRLFALSFSSCQFLKNIGVWEKLAAYSSPIKKIHVSFKDHFGAVRLSHHDINIAELGSVIPAKNIEAVLNHELQNISHFQIFKPATVTDIEQKENCGELSFIHQGQAGKLTGTIIIGADGTHSTIRKLLHIDTQTIAYQQSALVTRTLLKRGHEGVAYERFTKEGAIAMLPLQDNECATILTAKSDRIENLMTLKDHDFLNYLQKQFGYRLGSFLKNDSRYTYPLVMMKAEKMSEGSFLLLGNAAHTLHPIAAQGFNLALFEVAAFQQIISEKLQQQLQVAAADLKKMDEIIQKQQAVSLGLSHRLSTFSFINPFLSNLLLSIGMVSFDILPIIKKRFINRFIGKANPVPPLLMSADTI